MYNVAPPAARAWRALFERAYEECGLAPEWIEHAHPLPIADLWARPDLACGFMCGWPFSHARGMQPIAVPVPAMPRYQDEPRYCGEFLVRIESPAQALQDTFGQRFGWMAADSQSGFNAPRHHLSQFVSAERPALYAEVKGPLGAPLRSLAALERGEVDVVALDSFFLDLLRLHDPARLAGMRSVGMTRWTPIPLLVAAPGIDPELVERLGSNLVGMHDRPELAGLLGAAGVARFAPVDPAAYGVFDTMAAQAASRGYSSIR
jgi:ABC-type phosphate/phosphonate transport system substrate-binding protein